jgi:hypothetical protein
VRQKIKLVRALNGLLYTNWEMLHGFWILLLPKMFFSYFYMF